MTNEQQLHRCRTCPIYIAMDRRLCRACAESPGIEFLLQEPWVDERRGERRAEAAEPHDPARRAGVDRRGITRTEWRQVTDEIRDAKENLK